MAQQPNKYELEKRLRESQIQQEENLKNKLSHSPSEGLTLGVLEIIRSQLDYYPEMFELSVCDEYWNPSSIITGPGLVSIKERLDGNSRLLQECYSFMDTLMLVETLHYNTVVGSTVDSMLLSIIKSRQNEIVNKNVNTSSVDLDTGEFFTFNENEEVEEDLKTLSAFLASNKVIVAFYLYRLTVRFYGIDFEFRNKQNKSREIAQQR